MYSGARPQTGVTRCAIWSFARSVLGQSIVDDTFEAKYWESNPDDNYSRGIRLWNERVCFVKDPGVFYHGFTEMKDRDVADCMANVCDVSLAAWKFSAMRREYAKDDFIPTLAFGICPDDVFNVFQGLKITYADCREADVKDAEPLLQLMRLHICLWHHQPRRCRRSRCLACCRGCVVTETTPRGAAVCDTPP
jgi:hypothetical protein